MEDIKFNLLYQQPVGIKGRYDSIVREVPKTTDGLDAMWLLTEINFSVRGEKCHPSAFMFEVGKKNTKNNYVNIKKKSEIFTIPYNTNHYTIEYDKHFTVRSGEVIVPTIIEVGKNSNNWTIYLKFAQHYDINGCCKGKNPFEKMEKYYNYSIVDEIVLVDDL